MLALSLQTEFQSLEATVMHFVAGLGRKKFHKGNDKHLKTLFFYEVHLHFSEHVEYDGMCRVYIE